MRILPLALALFATVLPASAQSPFRVADIRTTGTGGTETWPWGSEFVEVAGTVYFNISDGIHGMELWASDGTEAGTRLVMDICPGVCAGAPRGLTAVGSTLYFSADDGTHGPELWKSDGTAAGTTRVADLVPGMAGSSPGSLAELGGKLLFSAMTPALGRELWTSDGTAAGTVLLRDIQPGGDSSSPTFLARLGGRLLWSAYDSVHGYELWASDGTAAGTVLVADIAAAGGGLNSTAGQPGYAAVLGGRLLFTAGDGTTGQELWASDGTEAGTVRVKDIAPGAEDSVPHGLTTWGDAVYFSAWTAASGWELWKSDGTEAGTVRVADVNPGSASSSPRELAVAGGRLYFRAFHAAHGSELWKSDGTEAGTVQVKDIRPGTDSGLLPFFRAEPTAVGPHLLFAADDGVAGLELWKSDGTEAGTVLLADLNPGPAPSLAIAFFSERRAVIAGRWYFLALTGGDGLEVHVSDGTAAGTHKLKEINAQSSAFEIGFFADFFGPDPFTDLAGTLFFAADDGLAGAEVWKSDGTAAGTSRVADLEPGSNPSFPYDFTPLPESVLFSAAPSATWRELYRSDGTPGGSGLLMDFEPANSSSGGDPQQLTAWGGKVYFHAPRPGAGDSRHELWKSDGTPAGTVPVVDPLPSDGPRSGGALVPFGPRLYFAAAAPATGSEMWSTDGTAAGTVPVADLRPGTPSSQPLHLSATPARLFFSADDGIAGREPWVTDGTAAGTFRLKDIRPGTAGSIPADEGFPQGATLAAAAGGLFFFVADDGTTGEELWRSDGTAAGTVRVADISPGAAGSEPRWLTAVGGKVYFTADDGSTGRELWVSDGTAAGTFRVLDIVAGAGSSLPLHLAAFDGRLLFSASDAAHGRELWTSRGTAASTRRLADLAPGPLPSSPLRFTASGANIYFTANDGTSGFELYALPKGALGTSFYTLPPCRIADTRPDSPLATDIARTFAVTGACGIPATATALALNLTAVTPTGDGFLTAWPAGSPMPSTSTLNFRAGQVRANNAVLPVSAGGLAVAASVSSSGQMHLILDVVGYFQ